MTKIENASYQKRGIYRNFSSGIDYKKPTSQRINKTVHISEVISRMRKEWKKAKGKLTLEIEENSIEL